MTPVIKNQETPATATPAKPAAVPGKATRKRVPSTHKTKGHAPAAGTPEETTEKAVEDAPMPPSPIQATDAWPFRVAMMER